MTDSRDYSTSEKAAVDVVVNGTSATINVDPFDILADTLRERLDCLSVRQSCGIGICGTCTVIVDDHSINSCSMLTVQANGSDLVTSEGLASTERLSRVQRAFVDSGAFQCSFCIPGFVLTIEGLLRRNPQPSREEVNREIEGNLCRCGSYPRILAAVDQLVTDLIATYNMLEERSDKPRYQGEERR